MPFLKKDKNVQSVSEKQMQMESVLLSLRDEDKKLEELKASLEIEKKRLHALQKLSQRHQATIISSDDQQ